MKKTPIEVSGLRKAPAIVVNRGDEVRILGRWYVVAGYSDAPGCIMVRAAGQSPESVHVDIIDEWRKG